MTLTHGLPSAGSLADQLAPLATRMRSSYSLVRPVSQVVLKLRPQAGIDPFVQARDVVIGWIRNRAGRPLSYDALQGKSFELEEVGSQRTAAISIDNPRYWAARLDDGDSKVAQRVWVTEIGIAEHQNNDVICGVRLQCVTMGEDQPFEPSIPRFVRTIIERVPNVRLEGRRISPEPWIVQTEDDVDNLVACIESPGRRLDVIVCALPEASEDPATATVQADQIHRRVLGSAHVAVITGSASFYLSDLVGKEFSVFRGAVRTYRPAFDTSQDEPFRHPLALPTRIVEWPGGGREAYERFLVGQTLARAASGSDADSQLPPFTEVRRVAAQIKLDAARDTGSSDSDMLELAESEIKELRDSIEKDRTTYQGLVDQYERERDQALEESLQVLAASNHLRQRIRALEEQINSQPAAQRGTPIPDSLNTFEIWCRDHLSSAVEVHNRAIQAVKKSRYQDVGLIFQAMLILRDFYVPMKREGGIEKKEQFDRKCAELGLTDEATFSGDRWGEEGDTYKVRYAGRSRLLDRHLKKGTGRDERYCFRLYYFWDDDTEQAVVGWLPSHLDTRST